MPKGQGARSRRSINEHALLIRLPPLLQEPGNRFLPAWKAVITSSRETSHLEFIQLPGDILKSRLASKTHEGSDMTVAFF